MKTILSSLIGFAFTGAVIISCSSSSTKTADVADPAPVASTKVDVDHPEDQIGPSHVVAKAERSPNLGASSSGYAR